MYKETNITYSNSLPYSIYIFENVVSTILKYYSVIYINISIDYTLGLYLAIKNKTILIILTSIYIFI